MYFIWINKISYLTYAYGGLLQSQLTGLMVQDPAGAMVEALALVPGSILNGLTMSQNIGILAAIYAGTDMIKLTALHLGHRLKIV